MKESGKLEELKERKESLSFRPRANKEDENGNIVRMTEEGDLFSQSRDYEDLSLSLAATNVITGTLTRHRGGYLLNARAVDLNSKVLIASAQIFVPYDVVDSVLNENLEPPIKLNNISKDTQLVDSPRGIPLRKHVTRP